MYEKHLHLVDTLHYMFRIIKFIVTFLDILSPGIVVLCQLFIAIIWLWPSNIGASRQVLFQRNSESTILT